MSEQNIVDTPSPRTSPSPFRGETERGLDVNELLSAVPSWIVRRGITAIFLIIVAVVSLSFFIKYPDTLSAAATITTVNPPVTLVAKTSGKIIELKADNNQSVKKGDVLLVIESNADYNYILILDSLLTASPLPMLRDTLLEEKGIRGEALGNLTPAYLNFLKCSNEYQLQVAVNPQQKEIEIINKQLIEYQALQDKYQNQESTYKEELSLVEKDFNRSQTLFKSNAISAKEFEDKKKEYLSAQRNYDNIKIANINNTLTIGSLEKNKLQLQMQAYQEKEKYEQAFSQSKQTLKAQIETWKQTYLLTAPIAGKVSLFSYRTKNQNVKQGDEVLSIIPVEEQQVIAQLLLPVQNSGKLKTGQTVNIKLNNYVFQEYGMLKGFVKTISPMPKNEMYAIEVSLPNQLNTTYHKQLKYQQEMQGVADVITEELSIFDRVFYKFRKMVLR